MPHIAVVGAGITGVTTAYALAERGFEVTVFDRHRYAGMETSFANGGQLSASNAEVWNKMSTVIQGLKWMTRRDAPLLVNPRPSWHKYAWMAEFVANIRHYEANTVETVRLAIEARRYMFAMAEREAIDFNVEKRGILHFYRDRPSFEKATKVNALLAKGGLDRRAVTPEEIRAIEPTLRGSYYGGFYTPSDATGDIHKFTRGLAEACARRGVAFRYDAAIEEIRPKGQGGGYEIRWLPVARDDGNAVVDRWQPVQVDGVVLCAGTERDQDRDEPPRPGPLPGRRHGRVQRLQPRHPPRPHPAAGALDARAVPAGGDRPRRGLERIAADVARDAAARRPGPAARPVLQYRPRSSRLDALGRDRADRRRRGPDGPSGRGAARRQGGLSRPVRT